MALNKGDAGCTNGLSQRIYAAMTTDTVGAGFGVANEAALSSSARSAIKAICWAVATAVVDEIQANAVATIGGSSGTVS